MPLNVARIIRRVLQLTILAIGPLQAEERVVPQPSVESDGTIHVPAFSLPVSDFLDAEAREALQRMKQEVEQMQLQNCPSIWNPKNLTLEAIAETRACYDKGAALMIGKQRARYDVTIEPKTMGGVYTEIITPTAGVPPENRKRVLINLHGGGMVNGARLGGQIESIPIAAVGKVKVVSIDYRMAPEHRFPAANADIAAVYKALLKSYEPKNIGIYGCSAGGRLAGQSVAWFLKKGLPLPGAVGIFCSAPAVGPYRGDSAHITSALYGVDFANASLLDAYYGKDADTRDPLIFPLSSTEVMAKFPPTLLISGGRNFSLSYITHTHAQLVKNGVDADLHIWEGFEHGFFLNPDLPQSRDAYDVIVRFFGRHLGR